VDSYSQTTKISKPSSELPPGGDTSGAEPDGRESPDAGAASSSLTPSWRRLESGRWEVGDAGLQERVVPLIAKPYSRPDTVGDGALTSGLTIRAASLRGLSHQQVGKTRQDAYAYIVSPDGNWLVGCVADGVSEGELSHEAADIACTQLTECLVAAVDGLKTPPIEGWGDFAESLPWREAVSATNRTILRAAQSAFSLSDMGKQGGSMSGPDVAKIMSTTAIALLIPTSPDADGSHPFSIAVAAGDSSAVQLKADGWEPLTAVKNAGAEIASSAVRPLPFTDDVVIRLGQLDPGECLALISDGVGDPLGSGQGVVGRFLAESWRAAPDVGSFIAQVGFLRKTFVDDRTALCVWSRPPG
jgi:Protein phosphatase 2C